MAVTGAFGYSGKRITRELLARGDRVLALTNSLGRPHPFGQAIEVAPLAFADPTSLSQSLSGCDVLVNTYWVRFNHRTFSHAQAVADTKVLFSAARAAGVGRIVHVSITNPARDSSLEYFRGKAELEEALMGLGIPYAIARPAVLFGDEDILINNMAYLLRRLPVFGMFGDGQYRLRPIHVDDFAKCIVVLCDGSTNTVVEAVGPESFTYLELLKVLASALGVRRRFLRLPPWFGYVVGTVAGWLLRDRLITWEEIKGLMQDRLWVDAPAAGTTRLSDWAKAHADTLGRHYASELRRRRDRDVRY
jgi:NADH dehydrogenase